MGFWVWVLGLRCRVQGLGRLRGLGCLVFGVVGDSGFGVLGVGFGGPCLRAGVGVGVFVA